MEPERPGISKQGGKPQSPGVTPLKAGELPSVLRTSVDLSGKTTSATSGTSPGKPDAAKQQPNGRHISGADIAATASLPRLDPAAHLQALPARSPKPASPPRPARGSPTPDKCRHNRQHHVLRNSGDDTLAAAPLSPGALQPIGVNAGASRQSPATPRSFSKRLQDGVPAVGVVAMSTLPASYHRVVAAEGDSSTPSAAPYSPRSEAPTTPAVSPSMIAAAAATCSAAPDDVRLLRPVDPSKPGYYWKPVQGDAAAAAVRESLGPAVNAENVLGYQLLQEVARPETLTAPVSHVRQRKSMLMRLPLGTEHFLEAVPAAVHDSAGHACLLVLPSDKPSSRKEALAVEAFLCDLFKDSDTAVLKACQWRAAVLAELCCDSLGVVAEALKHRGPPVSWQFKGCTRTPAGRMLGSSMMEPLDHVLTSQDKTTYAAEKMADLLNPREATAQVGVAAAAATLAAAVAVAPATVRMPSALSSTCKAAASAMTELNETADAAHRKQEQLQQRLQEHLEASTNRHYQLQLGHRPDSPRGHQQQQQQPQADKIAAKNRSSAVANAGSPSAGRSSNQQQQAHMQQAEYVASGNDMSRVHSYASTVQQLSAIASNAAEPIETQQQSQQQIGMSLLIAHTPSTSTLQTNSKFESGLGSNASRSRSPNPDRPSQDQSSATAGAVTLQQPGHHHTSAEEQLEGQATQQSGDVQEHQRHHELSSLYGLSLAASVCMADLIRQVEVACVERGRALAYAWNCSVGAAEAALVELHGQNQKLLTINSTLAQDLHDINKELKGLDFLRREALRFRRDFEETSAELNAATADNVRLKDRLQLVETDLEAVDSFCNRRLARLRWRNAFAVLGTWSQQSTIQSGGHKRGPGQLLGKVTMLEQLANAVNGVEHRKQAYGRSQSTEKFEYNAPHVVDLVQVMTLGPQVAAPGRVHDGYNIDSTVQMLTSLTPEARTMVLATLPPAQRWKILEAMRDDERAAMVIAMSLEFRQQASEAVDQKLWERTMDVVKNNSMYGARYLTSMDIDDAAKEFHTWTVFQQVDVLAALDIFTAAGIMTRTDEPMRKELLSMLEPYLAANIVQAMMPPPAAVAVDALDNKKAIPILVAMDPNKAADVLAEMGPGKAAGKLMLMDPDARNCIIESMTPRDAAHTLTKMEDALQQAMDAAGGESPELLSLNGSSLESPTRDAMAEMTAQNAYNVFSYMSIQDKAALLASMEPGAVARLLGLMDPQEAVLLLSALGDGHDKLISQVLSSEERDRMVQVLQAADCKPAKELANRSRKKGSVKQQRNDTDTVERLVDTYQAIAAGEIEQDAESPAESASKATPTNTRNAVKKQPAKKPLSRSVGIQVGDASGGSDQAVATFSDDGNRKNSSTGFAEDVREDSSTAIDAAPEAAATIGDPNSTYARTRGNKAPAGKVKAKDGRKVANNVKKTADDRRISVNRDMVDGEDDASSSADSTAVPSESIAGPAAPNRAGSDAQSATPAESRDSRRAKPANADAIAHRSNEAADDYSADGYEEGTVPPLHLAGKRELLDDATPPTSGRKLKCTEEDSGITDAASSGECTPAVTTAGAATSRSTARNAGKAASTAAVNAAAGRKALKAALKTHAATKKPQRTSNVGAATSVDAILKEASQLLTPTDDGPASESVNLGRPAPAAPDAPPQQRLGKVPKNARLIEAMAQHKNAKPKPKGWLLAIVDSIYKEGETLLRKLGRADMIKKQSVPEVVFAFFHNKYGQRALVNENVGSLVNTLTLYQRSDLKLEAFARLLSEEWDVSIFLDFLNAQNMCMQPAKLACIEYPREASKDEQYPWVCLYKAVWVADTILGMRAQAARDRFNEFLHMASVPADDTDVERFRQQRREAAAKDATARQQQEELPDKFFKLPRIRFLLILCKEICRINKFITTFGGDKFNAMDVKRTEVVDIVLVRSFVKAMSPGVNDLQVSDNIDLFVATAEAAVCDIAPEQVSVPSVTQFSREAFVIGVSSTQFIREHIKMNLLTAARLEEDDAEAQVFFNLLSVLMMRHTAALLPTWQAAIEAAGDRGRALQQQLAAVMAAGSGGNVRLKEYVSFLLALMNTATQSYLDSFLGSHADVESVGPDQLEDGLSRLEDAALILLGNCSYLVDEMEDKDLAKARMTRLPTNSHLKTMGRQLVQHRKMKENIVLAAALVMQRIWLKKKYNGDNGSL